MSFIRIFLFVSICSVLTSVWAAQIYRSVDEKGNLSFSDRDSPSAEKVELESIIIVSKPRRVLSTFNSAQLDEENLARTTFYNSFSIVSPRDGETIRNVREIAVRIVSEPKIAWDKGREVVLYLNSEPYSLPSADTSMTLSGLERGKHRLEAVVLDSDEVALIRAMPIVFYLHQHSKLHSRKP